MRSKSARGDSLASGGGGSAKSKNCAATSQLGSNGFAEYIEGAVRYIVLVVDTAVSCRER